MKTESPVTITVETTVMASPEKVWNCWTAPEHITKWCQASDDWHAPRAENDVRKGGKFVTEMAAKDGSFSFEFGGTYDEVIPQKHMSYTMGDGRRVVIDFKQEGNGVHIVETFDPESTNPHEMQKGGWQAILNNFRNYVESLA